MGFGKGAFGSELLGRARETDMEALEQEDVLLECLIPLKGVGCAKFRSWEIHAWWFNGLYEDSTRTLRGLYEEPAIQLFTLDE